uniref:Uncharacterized protein n=1 Tax=Ditylenchus dipsaci TaxID=166011 RepID=A0A915CSS5_9BILA
MPKLSREVLQTAFHRNVAHFRSGNYALGLEGMVEFIVSSYGTAHIVQVPSLGLTQGIEGANSIQLPPSNLPSSSSVGQFIAHGVRQKPEQKYRLKNLISIVFQKMKDYGYKFC